MLTVNERTIAPLHTKKQPRQLSLKSYRFTWISIGILVGIVGVSWKYIQLGNSCHDSKSWLSWFFKIIS